MCQRAGCISNSKLVAHAHARACASYEGCRVRNGGKCQGILYPQPTVVHKLSDAVHCRVSRKTRAAFKKDVHAYARLLVSARCRALRKMKLHQRLPEDYQWYIKMRCVQVALHAQGFMNCVIYTSAKLHSTACRYVLRPSPLSSRSRGAAPRLVCHTAVDPPHSRVLLSCRALPGAPRLLLVMGLEQSADPAMLPLHSYGHHQRRKSRD